MKKLTTPVMFLLAAALLLGFVGSEDDSPLVGTAAPDFTLSDYNGNQISLSSLQGETVLLVFWFPT